MKWDAVSSLPNSTRRDASGTSLRFGMPSLTSRSVTLPWATKFNRRALSCSNMRMRILRKRKSPMPVSPPATGENFITAILFLGALRGRSLIMCVAIALTASSSERASAGLAQPPSRSRSASNGAMVFRFICGTPEKRNRPIGRNSDRAAGHSMLSKNRSMRAVKSLKNGLKVSRRNNSALSFPPDNSPQGSPPPVLQRRYLAWSAK